MRRVALRARVATQAARTAQATAFACPDTVPSRLSRACASAIARDGVWPPTRQLAPAIAPMRRDMLYFRGLTRVENTMGPRETRLCGRARWDTSPNDTSRRRPLKSPGVGPRERQQ